MGVTVHLKCKATGCLCGHESRDLYRSHVLLPVRYLASGENTAYYGDKLRCDVRCPVPIGVFWLRDCHRSFFPQ